MSQTIQKTITTTYCDVLVGVLDEGGKVKRVSTKVEFIGPFSNRKMKKAIKEKFNSKSFIVEGIREKQTVYELDVVDFMQIAKIKEIKE